MKIRIKHTDYLKAIRKSYREAELEISIGWVCKNKIHKNKKNYKRIKININDNDRDY